MMYRLPKKALKYVVTFQFCLSFLVTHAPLSTMTRLKVSFSLSFRVVIKLWEVRTHNHSIIFLFLVFRDIIVANKTAKPSFHPRICNAMTFDMKCRYVIGIPRDLFLNIAVTVKPFSFFSSTTVKIRWLLKSVRAREQKKLCAMLASIFWWSTINPRSTILQR